MPGNRVAAEEESHEMPATNAVLACLLALAVVGGQNISATASDIAPGTTGTTLPAPAQGTASTSIAILGDIVPADTSTPKYLSSTLQQLNLLRPAAVFTVGGLIPGLTRSTQRYAEEAHAFHDAMRTLQMPWYPCVGFTEVTGGSRNPADRTLEDAYKKTFGPLYYSVNVGATSSRMAPIHVIVLDTEEGCGEGSSLTESQLAWLKADLNRTFLDNGVSAQRTRGPSQVRAVVVLMHRPLWRIAEKQGPVASNWDRVHRLLVDFNQRPIVSVEGAGVSEGPRVVGVWAGSARAYSKEPTRDGIRYTVLGASAAHLDDPANAVRHFTLLTFDDADGNVHPALVALGPRAEHGPAILPDDVITERERQILDAIQSLPSSALGLEGAIDLPALTDAPLTAATQPAATLPLSTPAAAPPPIPEPPVVTMNIGNPLDVPLDIQIRLAGDQPARSDRRLQPPVDTRWEMDLPHQIRHLAPGAKETWPAHFTWHGRPEDAPPPVVEFVVHWSDPRGGGGGVGGGESGQVREVILRRRVPVVSHNSVPTAAKVSLTTDEGWTDALAGSTFSWPALGEMADLTVAAENERAPDWEMIADPDRVLIRIRVEDGVKSYSPHMTLEQAWGGLPSDAVSVAWASGGANGAIQRLWLLPFGPQGPELWELPASTAAGANAPPLVLQRVAPGRAVQVPIALDPRPDGYTLTLALPRQWLSFRTAPATTRPARPSLRLAIEVSNNDDGAPTYVRSSAPLAAGPSHWSFFDIPPVRSPAPAAQKDNK